MASLRTSLAKLNTYKDVIAEITLYELLDEPNQAGNEAHFGLRTNLATPKAAWNVVAEFATAKAEQTPTPDPVPEPAAELPVVGVNMGMLSNNPQVYPGIEGRAYHKWDRENVKARAVKGCRLMRMPIAWARLQQFQGQPMTANQTYVGEILESLDIAKEFGIRVIVDCHAFFRPWAGKVVTDPNALVDFWSKLDDLIGKHPAVWAYDLMNEPYTMDDALVFTMIQAAVTAVNKRNPNVVLMIPGRDYSDAYSWPQRSDDLKKIQGKNLMFTAHKYIFNGGRYRSDAEATAAVEPDTYIKLVQPFADWCKANGVRGYLGEVGVPHNSPTALAALDRLLLKCVKEWRMPVTYWADGNGWPDADYLALTSGGDTYVPANDRRTILDVLEKHFPSRVQAYGQA